MKTDLKITFITNYMTHHQLPFCKEMYKILGDNFAFLQTTAMEEERKNMGFLMDVKNLGFVSLINFIDSITREFRIISFSFFL